MKMHQRLTHPPRTIQHSWVLNQLQTGIEITQNNTETILSSLYYIFFFSVFFFQAGHSPSMINLSSAFERKYHTFSRSTTHLIWTLHPALYSIVVNSTLWYHVRPTPLAHAPHLGLIYRSKTHQMKERLVDGDVWAHLINIETFIWHVLILLE